MGLKIKPNSNIYPIRLKIVAYSSKKEIEVVHQAKGSIPSRLFFIGTIGNIPEFFSRLWLNLRIRNDGFLKVVVP